MYYVIAVEGTLTSFVFYNEVVAQLHNYFAEDNPSRILFDFSRTKRIDPLVLPNLLCAGFLITKYRNVPAKIFVPGNLEFKPLRTFLNRTRFVELSREYGLFEFDESISGGLEEQAFSSTLNRLEVFHIVYKTPDSEDAPDQDEFGRVIDVETTRRDAFETLKSSFAPFINEFIAKSADKKILQDREGISNNLLSFGRELVENALLHGRSFCFLNMQYSSANGKQIKISISDCGMGFKDSLNMDHRRARDILSLENKQKTSEANLLCACCYPLNHNSESEKEEEENKRQNDDVVRLSQYPLMKTELEGIIYGLLSRREKPYGLYNIHSKTVRATGGAIRIHSNDTQLILSQRMGIPLAIYGTPESLLTQFIQNKYAKNVRSDLKFKGVHIEIEWDLETREEDEK